MCKITVSQKKDQQFFSLFSRDVIFGLLVALIILLSAVPHRSLAQQLGSDSLWNGYKKLYEHAVYPREADSLYRYIDHMDLRISRQAWRAMAHTPVNNIYKMMERVRESNLPVAWMALSLKKLDESNLQTLQNWWVEQPELRPGIALVLGRQGDAKSLDFLFEQVREIRGSHLEYPVALAIGRLCENHEVDISRQFTVIRSAFLTDDVQIGRAWLYGAYRGKDIELDPEVRQNLYKLWKFSGIGERPKMDRYLTGILGRKIPDLVIQSYANAGIDSINAEVGIELADVLNNQQEPDTGRVGRMLLDHINPMVQVEALQTYRNHKNRPTHWLESRVDSLLADSVINKPHVWMEALLTKAQITPDSIGRYITRIDTVVEKNLYLLPQALDVYAASDSTRKLLKRVDRYLLYGSLPIPVLTVRWLAHYVDQMPEEKQTSRNLQQLRKIVRDALTLHDRGVTYELEPLLSDPRLIGGNDYKLLRHALDDFALPADIEAYQAMARVFYDDFRKQARPFIDTLAAHGYQPMNSSLQQIGWNIDQVPDTARNDSLQNFYQPNWNRLEAMGTRPHLVLQTEKGKITIEMDRIRTPATVSAIDSLARSGYYDGVPFHRVVPKFVIQGGDIERGDGFGGPLFRLPTEASELGFSRGAVGIASAGPDTEGSQYFIMHRWKPHLNAKYTRFGKVIKGMDVVDRIMPGDKVLNAQIVTRDSLLEVESQ